MKRLTALEATIRAKKKPVKITPMPAAKQALYEKALSESISGVFGKMKSFLIKVLEGRRWDDAINPDVVPADNIYKDIPNDSVFQTIDGERVHGDLG